MPRKKPFSSKQKKRQLKDKRRKKQEGACFVSDESDDDEVLEDKDEGPEKSEKSQVTKINQQPGRLTGKQDPNRYRLHFHTESKDVLAKRKEQAIRAYQPLPQTSLELHLDSSVLDIPRRPSWDYNLSKAVVEENEAKYFKEYVDKIIDDNATQELSYFEMNLETWRQLWRVLEMSDVFLLITDIRHPALHFSPGLYKYITEELHKSVILVLNKVDLAPPSLVVAWQHYFQKTFPSVKVVCFTSFPKSQKELTSVTEGLGKVVFKRRRRGTFVAQGPRELYKICTELVKGQVDLSSWSNKIEEDQGMCYHGDSESDEEEEFKQTTQRPDLSFHHHEQYKDGVLTIGCIGFPNVGKSSVINGLMGKKVVSVSRTPGHTKHFQTIFLTPTVKLCDCPGLVFPSRADRNLQILAGIYPIAQVREPYSTIQYLAQRLDLPRLLRIKPLEDSADFQWSAFEICDSWADKRGFVTAKAARLDTYRAANNLLRLAVDGRICLCLVPPGYFTTKDSWESHPDTEMFIKHQAEYHSKLQASGHKDQDSADSSSDNGSQQGKKLSHEEGMEEEENSDDERKQTFKTSNMFDLLGDEN